MVILIAGTTHTGKTQLAQKLLEKYKISYLSIDHLKMGLIRSGNTILTPNNEKDLTIYLWPIIKAIIKTVIENKQNLIIEGCYIPFNWNKNFKEKYLKHIQYFCIIMTEKYINNNFFNIIKFENVIEQRLNSSYLNKQTLIYDNNLNFKMCIKYNYNYILIEDNYEVNLDLKGIL